MELKNQKVHLKDPVGSNVGQRLAMDSVEMSSSVPSTLDMFFLCLKCIFAYLLSPLLIKDSEGQSYAF